MEEKKPCELCNNLATMYCKSDQANLCWDCDARVHGANFLAAKHPRSLLYRLCQSPTPRRASGLRLALIVLACKKCIDRRGWDDHGDTTWSSHREGGGDDSDCNGDRNGSTADGDSYQENQVVPGRSSLEVASPPSSADSRASDSNVTPIPGKRLREEPELCSAWGSTSNWKKHSVLIK